MPANRKHRCDWIEAHCSGIADHRGWEDRKKIRERVRNTLRFAATAESRAWVFFHFLNMQSGDRDFQSEVSSIDTRFFLCGALACRAYFDDAEIRDLATKIYERVDWGWLLQGEKTLSMAGNRRPDSSRRGGTITAELMDDLSAWPGVSDASIAEGVLDAWKRPPD